MKNVVIFLLLFIKIEARKSVVTLPNLSFEPCLGSHFVATYPYGSLPKGQENQYYVAFNMDYAAGTKITIELDAEAAIEMPKEISEFSVLSLSPQDHTFVIHYVKKSSVMVFIVKGTVYRKIPYFSSVKINGIEQCETPVVGYLDDVVKNLRIARQVKSSLPDHECGRRKLRFNELIVNGESTEPGEWPWHAAIYRRKGAKSTYMCGGTLISKLFVLTAAQCATINKIPVVPDLLNVVLGKYHLAGGDVSSQEREVYSVIIHENFASPQRLDNDIALLKLKTEAVYSDYVQPACLWSCNDNKLPTNDVIGVVVGWGFNKMNANNLSPELKQASLPMITELKCIKSSPIFYGTMLQNDRKFCAGLGNGTSPCNGDSGGGFMVHVPDDSSTAGIWYIRGIVSTVLPYPRTRVCDPSKYVVFTDMTKYGDWIRIKTHVNIYRL